MSFVEFVVKDSMHSKQNVVELINLSNVKRVTKYGESKCRLHLLDNTIIIVEHDYDTVWTIVRAAK